LSATGTPWLVVSTWPLESTRTRSSGCTAGQVDVGDLDAQVLARRQAGAQPGEMLGQGLQGVFALPGHERQVAESIRLHIGHCHGRAGAAGRQRKQARQGQFLHERFHFLVLSSNSSACSKYTPHLMPVSVCFHGPFVMKC
jgi:hypothetical protein